MAKKIDKKKLDKIKAASQATAEAGAKQREALVIDFDAFHEEYKAQGNEISIMFGGKKYKLPSEPTGEVFVFMLRKMNDGAMSDEDSLTILEMALGDEFIQAVGKSQAPIKLVMEKIFAPIMKQWGFGGDVKHESKNVKTPAS